MEKLDDGEGQALGVRHGGAESVGGDTPGTEGHFPSDGSLRERLIKKTSF